MKVFRNFIVVLFFILLIFYVLLQSNFIVSTEKNFSENIRSEVKILQQVVKKDLFEIAKSLSKNPELIEVMKNKNYKKLYEKNFFKIPKEYIDYKDIKVHVVDKNGVQRYLSWTRKDLGKNILNIRKDLQIVFQSKNPLSSASVGKFSVSIKGIFPIFDDNGEFLGIIETITHPDFISRKLSHDKIYSAVIIDKKFRKQLIYPISKIFINGYNVANTDINPKILKILKRVGIEYFINIKDYVHVSEYGKLFKSYHVLQIPIFDFRNKKIGYYLVFAYDRFYLMVQEILLYIFLIILSILFVIMVILAKKEHKKNLKLIQNLDNEVKKQIDEKMELIYKDSLTKAYKKSKFDEDRYKTELKKTVILNIKNFSKINEIYGFEVGDIILKDSVAKLKDILQRNIYRLNADEFLFFTDNAKQDIKKIKNRFISEPIKLTNNHISIRISFSFGVVKTNTKKLISKLSIALKRAKNYPFVDFMYYKDNTKRNREFLKFNSLLQEAIFEDSEDVTIVPYFQGIRDNISGKITRFEALARLKARDEIYSPYYFLDIAKNSGFIHEVTNIMIQKSFKELSKFDDSVSISINITESDLATRQLKDILTLALKRYDIEANRVTLEVLEGITTTSTKNNYKQLSILKDMGFKIAIDDFGVEYSNFERLSQFDVDFIKIDGKYIKELGENSKSYNITKAISDFAHSLDIEVVAEFVENEEIQNIVESLGIEYSQGFYFSKPSSKIEVN